MKQEEGPAKVSRRAVVGGVIAVAGSLLIPRRTTDIHAQDLNNPTDAHFAINLHGFNGAPDASFTGAFNNVLKELKRPFKSPLLTGEMNPSLEKWVDTVAEEVVNSPVPPDLYAHSLSVIVGLVIASMPELKIRSLTTVSGRKVFPDFPLGFPRNLVDFYLQGGARVNLDHIQRNLPDGVKVVHSRDDTNNGGVAFDGNADELAQQTAGKKIFTNGFGHFTDPIDQKLFLPLARRILSE
jgi:predicted alpha/beta hydrolase family esterase